MKTFNVTYNGSDYRVYGQTFTATVEAVSEDKAREYFARFYPCASIIEIKEKISYVESKIY